MNTKTWIIFAVVCVAVLGGIIAISKQQNVSVDVSKTDTNSIISASAQNGNIADHVADSATSPVRLIEYGDIQCPYCGEAHPYIKQIVADYGDKIGFVFRNYPLTTVHPNAYAAATAAEAAGLQGKYWDMNNYLYEHQGDWDSLSSDQRVTAFVSYAKSLGINTTTFKNDLSSENVSKKIAFDQALGNKVGVTGTPAFFLNGKLIDQTTAGKLESGDPSAFRKLIDDALKAHNITPPANS